MYLISAVYNKSNMEYRVCTIFDNASHRNYLTLIEIREFSLKVKAHKNTQSLFEISKDIILKDL